MAETEKTKGVIKTEPRQTSQQERQQETQADPQNDRRNGRPSNPQLPTGSVGAQDILPRFAQMANALTRIAAAYGGTGKFLASDGDASQPSYTFVSNSSAGMYYSVSAQGPRFTQAGVLSLGFATTSNALLIPPTYANTTASAADMVINSSGQVFRSTSSLRYKRDIETLPFDIAAFRKLRPVTYRSKVGSDGDRLYGGLIAEELHDAGYSRYVSYNADGQPESIMYPHMVAELIAALHDAQDKIAALEARIDNLETPNG